MSLGTLLVGKKPPVLQELEVVGSGASATSVVKAVVRDPGGYSRLSVNQIIAVKKVYVPRYSVIQSQRRQRLQSHEIAPLERALDPTFEDAEFDEATCSSEDERRCAAIEREVSLLKSLDHPNIVSCYGVVTLSGEANMLGILMEYCPGNSLRHFYRKQQQLVECEQLPRDVLHGNGLPEELIRMYTAQMLDGLAYLHSHGVVHRDLKGLNVLLSADGSTCKLADFGSATQIALSGSDAMFHSMQGTVWWMAPEQFLLGRTGSTREQCLDGTGGSFVADVWSLGCLVLELALGAIPFSHVPGGQFGLMLLLSKPSVDEAELIPEDVASSLAPSVLAFVRRCLVRDPSCRPTAATLLADKWFEGVLPSPRLSRFALHHEEDGAADIGRVSAGRGDAGEAGSDDSIVDLTPNHAVDTTSSAATTVLLDRRLSAESIEDSPRFPVSALPSFVKEKLYDAALFWHRVTRSFDTSLTIGALFAHLRAPSLAAVLAPYFSFPRSAALSSDGGACDATAAVDFPTFVMFVSFFGPFETLLTDLWALEAEKYSTVGYADYGSYADYEASDSSHLILSCLSKPWCKLLLSQQEVEDAFKGSPRGTFVLRYSSKWSEAPGSLTLSIKGEHGVLHHRIVRPDSGWSFMITVPTLSERHRRRNHDLSIVSAPLRGGNHQQPLAIVGSAEREGTLCFDSVEDLVKFFALHGIPSHRSDRVYKLLVA